MLVEGGHIREVSDRPIKSATAEAIRRLIDFGLRSIEHGNLIDRATAEHVTGADARQL